MLKATVLAIAIGTVTMLFAFDAGALTLAHIKSQPLVENDITLVRDSCGRGYYYSERFGACVEARDHYHGYDDHRPYSYASCKHDCKERHAECNWERKGYFNGCGVAYNTCLTACK